MRIALSTVFLAIVVCVSPAWAQQAEREAEIKRLVPYSRMLLEDPTMTLRDYNDAVSALAAQQLRSEGFASELASPSPSYGQRPAYESPAPIYTPPSPYTPPRRYVSPYEQRSGTSYDWRSGNTYRWRKEYDGDTKVDGFNLNTGSTWQTTIKPDGSMNGYDSTYNPWRYNSRSNTYMNLGTGEICVGEGYARVCS